MKNNWVDKKFKKSHVVYQVDAIVYHRIYQHKKYLINMLKHEMKSISMANGNAKVKLVRVMEVYKIN